MKASEWAIVLAASIAALTTLFGYLISQSWARRERRAKIYADALAALRRYHELPYRIWRRPNSSPATRAAIGQEHSDTLRDLASYRLLLQVDADVVGTAYWDLWQQLRPSNRRNRNAAWTAPVLTSDEQMTEHTPFEHSDADAEYGLCVLAMRRELSLRGPLLRPATRRKLADQRRTRDRSATSESSFW